MRPTDSPPARPRRNGRRLPAPGPGPVALPGFPGVRLSVEQADDSLRAAARRLALPRSGWSREPFNILAISGGAAGGAWGAGLLAGLSDTGRRPNFAIVTGVSTGAMIAPFAFLGPDWDERLSDAYTGGHAARLFSLGAMAPGFGPALFRAGALDALVAPFIDETMLVAIAAEHARGRRLLVATTDLDSQKSCIWDMGAIATIGGEDAVALFRQVIIASASLPGIFPPRLFRVERDGEPFDEMHVDGGVASPLFIMPEALLRSRRFGRRLRGGRIYVLVNTVLEVAPRTTSANLAPVLFRSFDTMLRFSYRQALGTAAAFCAGADVPMSVASIPDATGGGSMMNFDTPAMRRMFDFGLADGRGTSPWSSPVSERFAWRQLLDSMRPATGSGG